MRCFCICFNRDESHHSFHPARSVPKPARNNAPLGRTLGYTPTPDAVALSPLCRRTRALASTTACGKSLRASTPAGAALCVCAFFASARKESR